MKELTDVQREKFWDQVEVRGEDECWWWLGFRNPSGYGQSAYGMAHRRSWVEENGDPGKQIVMHRCDNPGCVNPKHLKVGTHKDNTDDMLAKGRDNYHGFTPKLDMETAKIIRDLYKIGAATQAELADDFDLTYVTVNQIITNKRWKE